MFYLQYGKKKINCRNNFGKITIFHRGGGNKKKYRIIDFLRNLKIKAQIIQEEYDPNRSSNILLICYSNGFLSYILSFEYFKNLQYITNINKEYIGTLGCSYYLKQIPLNIKIHNINNYARAAGTFCIIIQKINNYACIQLPSKKKKLIHILKIATLGQVSQKNHKIEKNKKAGDSRNKNRRSSVRGTAQNAVDHPHGGGRGKTSGKNKTFKGKINKGKKTRSNKKTNFTIIKIKK
jgi:large subunit ribosomal protein L2